jgi:hypothetical protein
MTWLNVLCLCHRWPKICSVLRNHNSMAWHLMRFKIELLHLIFEKRFSEDINTLLKIIMSVAYKNGVGSKLLVQSWRLFH